MDEGPTGHTEAQAPPGWVPRRKHQPPNPREIVHPACGGNSRALGPEPPYSRGTGDDELPNPSTSHPPLNPTGEPMSGLPFHRTYILQHLPQEQQARAHPNNGHEAWTQQPTAPAPLPKPRDRDSNHPQLPNPSSSRGEQWCGHSTPRKKQPGKKPTAAAPEGKLEWVNLNMLIGLHISPVTYLFHILTWHACNHLTY